MKYYIILNNSAKLEITEKLFEYIWLLMENDGEKKYLLELHYIDLKWDFYKYNYKTKEFKHLYKQIIIPLKSISHLLKGE